MKRYILFSSIIAMVLIGCDSSSSDTSSDNATSSNSNSNEITSDTTSTTHYQGTSCLRCHGSNPTESNEGNEKVLTSGTTLYGALNSQNGNNLAQNYSLRLVLENSNSIVNFKQEKGSGNYSTNFPVGNINAFTVEVVDGNSNIVNSSLTNSHDLNRLDCNSCHTSAGINGAPGRVVNYRISTGLAGSSSSSSNVLPNPY